MKANELQIGDYVQHNGSAYVVEEISAKGWVHLIDPRYNVRVQMTSDYIIDLLKPIPLTREILRKNFGEEDAIGWFNMDEEYYEVYIREYTDSVWSVSYHSCEMNIEEQKVFVFHVHELQHILRFFGIEKEIVL